MIGIKMIHLFSELNVSARNELRARIANKTDKRFKILNHLLNLKVNNNEDLIDELRNLIHQEWPNSPDNDQKIRRISLFICEQIELVLIDDLINQNLLLKNSLIVKAVEKKGNLTLIKHYYDKLNKKAFSNNQLGFKIQSLNGKLRMNYASQNELELAEALKRNEELLELINDDYNVRLVDYYYQCSNIYLEQNHLLSDKKERIITEISNLIERLDNPILKASLFLSLSKLNYDNQSLNLYLENARKELNNVNEINADYEGLQRKIRFLEMRLYFFSGKDLDFLQNLSENIISEFNDYSIINNNVLFYRILFAILKNDFDKATSLLDDNTVFFQGESKIHKMFLTALLFEKQKENKKAIKILNQLMYTENYLVAIFSRFLFIKILFSKEKSSLLSSTIDSTHRLILKNKSNPLGRDSHQYVLEIYKSKANKTKKKIASNNSELTVLHKYLLADIE